ncbi:MAG TPA: hypothetical protein VG966_07480 [Hyphomicrobiaceae bacterium]|nr:hypothetical protein [Hyphomicrobiaceae bacterium]
MSPDGEARYEFRVFDDGLEVLRPLLSKLSSNSSLDQATETYIVTRLNIDAGVTIRGDCLEMKVLLAREGILDLWQPSLVVQLPVSGDTLVDVIAPALGVTVDVPGDAQLTEAALVDIAQSVRGLASVSVGKQRSLFEIESCTAELTDVDLPGMRTQSVALEGADFVNVMQLVRRLGLEQRANESYPCYLQRRLF